MYRGGLCLDGGGAGAGGNCLEMPAKAARGLFNGHSALVHIEAERGGDDAGGISSGCRRCKLIIVLPVRPFSVVLALAHMTVFNIADMNCLTQFPS